MIEVRIGVANDEVASLRVRLGLYRQSLVDDMIATNDHNPKVRTATTTYAFLGQLLAQLEEHDKKLRDKEKSKKR